MTNLIFFAKEKFSPNEIDTALLGRSPGIVPQGCGEWNRYDFSVIHLLKQFHADNLSAIDNGLARVTLIFKSILDHFDNKDVQSNAYACRAVLYELNILFLICCKFRQELNIRAKELGELKQVMRISFAVKLMDVSSSAWVKLKKMERNDFVTFLKESVCECKIICKHRCCIDGFLGSKSTTAASELRKLADELKLGCKYTFLKYFPRDNEQYLFPREGRGLPPVIQGFVDNNEKFEEQRLFEM